MGTRLQELAVQALQLSDQDRAELVSRLVASLSPSADFDADWSEVLDQRIQEIEAGRATMVPVDEAVARVRNLVR
jgi:putative addiction module component (TIGR02574 family)